MREKKRVVLDVECYKDYFEVGVRNIDTGNTLVIELYEGHPLDRELLGRVMRVCQIFTFNGNSYDIPMVYYALTGASNIQLKRASDAIIQQNLKPWEFERAFSIRIPKIDHIDLIEVAPGQASLKIYGGRVHTQRMQDLPVEPDASITPELRPQLVSYNGNDLNATSDLRAKLIKQLELRERMSAEYGMDLRSKSDAQIAEAVIKAQIEALTGFRPERPKFPAGTAFNYQIPDFIRYTTPVMLDVLEMVREARFVVESNGSVAMPDELTGADVSIGNSIYRMGIGGLHSSESSVTHIADDDTLLIDRDVRSYYPEIILGQSLFPKHLGPVFLKVYRTIVERRLKAKDAGDKVTADSLKITINGSFGKFGSKWSCLYSPHLMIQVTITGQLALLMLIEMLEVAGIPVVSANTDGVVIKCPKARQDDLNAIVADWEARTNFETEETQYSALFSRDVNNYIAVKTDGSVKLKGAFAEPGLQKNPANQIAIAAAVDALTKGVPVEETLAACKDITKFVTVRQVNGGAVYGHCEFDPKARVGEKKALLEREGWCEWPEPGVWTNEDYTLSMSRDEAYKHVTQAQLKHARYLGKAVRWYYGVGETRDIRYKTNSNTVSRSRGAVPLMDLPEEFPNDVDLTWYAREAVSILRDVGHPAYQWDAKLDHLI
ncbi:hypothetical protein NAV33_07345 [Pseudomonas stutzeri]|uniref:hypothetical protein n=1 Tax=Stutzerimonas stutzeri TaxID=316 RepID=UPI00210BD189|nr:hypothetical protein [Stutzerimonas stutzeri]MCQ4311709.1 hypothetical protein [Stutzerimonas stutzeri]